MKKRSAALHFLSNPEHNKYHVTSDGQCFVNRDNAVHHTKDLKDREIEEIERDDVKAEIAELKKKEKEAKAKGETGKGKAGQGQGKGKGNKGEGEEKSNQDGEEEREESPESDPEDGQ